MLRSLLLNIVTLVCVAGCAEVDAGDAELAAILKDRHDCTDASVQVMRMTGIIIGWVRLYESEVFDRGSEEIENLVVQAGDAFYEKYPKAHMVNIAVSGNVARLKHTATYDYRGGSIVPTPVFRCSDIRCASDGVLASPETS